MVQWSFVELDEVDSTQKEAMRQAARGAGEGTAVVAKSQTSGTGRLGRTWESPLGGLYMSVILRPGQVRRPELATLIGATAVVDGVRKATSLDTAIRWPNDVTFRTRKLGGVIAGAQSRGADIETIIVGIGVNCNAPASAMPALQQEATSISAELGREVDIKEVLVSILGSFSALYERWRSGEDMREEWVQRVGTVGKEISIKLKTGENPFSCIADDVDAQGNLVVLLEGETVAISPEDLEWLREQR